MSKIIAFSGSNSSRSINQRLVHFAASLVSEHEVEILSLIDFPAPVFGVDLLEADGFPESMTRLSAKMDEADGFIVSTPEHNGSMPAVLKNTIDWLSKIEGKVFRSKPTLFLSTSTGARGGQTALDHLVTIMPYRGANIVGHLSVPEFNKNFEGDVLSSAYQDQLKPLIQRLEQEVITSGQD